MHTIDIKVVVSNHGTPYKGVKDIPGTIEAEDYDMGGEGLAFHDSDNTNEGDAASYRTDGGGVDVVKCNGFNTPSMSPRLVSIPMRLMLPPVRRVPASTSDGPNRMDV